MLHGFGQGQEDARTGLYGGEIGHAIDVAAVLAARGKVLVELDPGERALAALDSPDEANGTQHATGHVDRVADGDRFFDGHLARVVGQSVIGVGLGVIGNGGERGVRQCSERGFPRQQRRRSETRRRMLGRIELVQVRGRRCGDAAESGASPSGQSVPRGCGISGCGGRHFRRCWWRPVQGDY